MQIVEPPRASLAVLPTPLIRLEHLGAELGCDQLWMKRDDLTGLELSGNKVRKLEYILEHARAGGMDTLLTEGTCQSNHCRATAAVCARAGLKAVILLRPEPPEEMQGNYLLDRLFGAELRCFDRDRFESERTTIVQSELRRLSDAGCHPRWVPMGASEPLGCWGYARAMNELGAQLFERGIESCDVVMPVSSGGTYAGALLGQCIYGHRHMHLSGVPVSDDVSFHQENIAKLCRETITHFDLPVAFDASAINLLDGYVGEGYAIPYPKAIDCIRLLARTEAILLDPVYTAKAFCALVDGVRDGRMGRDRPVVFMHTGGIFSNFAWPAILSA